MKNSQLSFLLKLVNFEAKSNIAQLINVLIFNQKILSSNSYPLLTKKNGWVLRYFIFVFLLTNIFIYFLLIKGECNGNWIQGQSAAPCWYPSPTIVNLFWNKFVRGTIYIFLQNPTITSDFLNKRNLISLKFIVLISNSHYALYYLGS